MNEAAATTATASATDAELVDAVRAGDEHAFAELYRRYRPRVCAFVRRRVRDDGRAEDLTQEAFLSALRRLRETEARVSFRPWIYEIARNATIDQFRRSARTDEVSVDGRLHASDHLRLLSPYGPDREVAAKQDLETLQGAFDELSDRHERILVMRELEGLSYREIGRRMELTRPGVESTLFRARRRLQSEFTELETGRRCLTVRGAMGRLVEGMNVRTDRGLVKRHVRRCAVCRADATGARPRTRARVACLARSRAAAFAVRSLRLQRKGGSRGGRRGPDGQRRGNRRPEQRGRQRTAALGGTGVDRSRRALPRAARTPRPDAELCRRERAPRSRGRGRDLSAESGAPLRPARGAACCGGAAHHPAGARGPGGRDASGRGPGSGERRRTRYACPRVLAARGGRERGEHPARGPPHAESAVAGPSRVATGRLSRPRGADSVPRDDGRA